LKAITAIQPDDLTPLAQVQALVGNVTTVLATNTGASLGALNANTTVNLNLNTNSTWTTNTTASKTGATVAEIIDPTTGRIKDVADKNLNTIRVVIEYSQSGGAGDGVLTAQLVNPGNVVIDQESEPININGQAETNVRGTFRFFVVKTSDNDFGYTLRLNNGAKALTAYRIVSVLRNNNP
jgi:phenylpyruvate tautomerase PptA (4-oxalocrotonate tautomerase family)